MKPIPDPPPKTSNTECVFEEARDRFLASLQPEDRKLYSPCASGDEFISALDKLADTTKKSSNVTKGLRCIHSLATQLGPYFDVVGVFVSSHPEFAALFWGAFRLVLQLSSHVVTFFEKLLDLISRLQAVFPQYSDILELCDDANAERIKKNVEEIYVDMLEIFQCAARVFTKASGKLKRTPVVLGSLMWKPFDIRFEDLLRKMAIHRENINAEVRVWKLKRDHDNQEETARWQETMDRESKEAKEERRLMTKERELLDLERRNSAESRGVIESLREEVREIRRAGEDQRRADTVRRIQKWLYSETSLYIRERHSQHRYPGSNQWVFQTAQFKRWSEFRTKPTADHKGRKFGKNMLWLYGHPGSGKSVLATSIIDNLESELDSSHQPRNNTLYHFFEFDTPYTRSPESAFRGYLWQLLSQKQNDVDLVDRFAFLMASRSGSRRGINVSSLVDFFHLCVDSRTVIIADGVDECDDSHIFIDPLLRISQTSAAKIILLSRVNVERLQRSVPLESQIALSKHEIGRDIYVYSQSILEEFVDDEVLPYLSSSDIDELASHMVHGADGMFLWVRLMFDFLRSSAISQERRTQIIRDIHFPEGLERMYERIISHIIDSGRTKRSLAANILTWILYRATAMSTLQTRQAATLSDVWTIGEQAEDLAEFEKAALVSCAGLIELVPLNPSSSFKILKFTHLTVREILKDQETGCSLISGAAILENAPSTVLPREVSRHLALASICLRQMLFHTPVQPLAGCFNESISAVDLASKHPFTDYAATQWIYHVTSATFDRDSVPDSSTAIEIPFLTLFKDFADLLMKFLSRPNSVSAWLEAYYTAQPLNAPSGSDLRKWASSLSDTCQSNILTVDSNLIGLIYEFRLDLDRIVSMWDSSLRLTPHIVWDEATGKGLPSMPSNGLFFSVDATRYTSRRPEPPLYGNRPVGYISSISKTSADGCHLGVLSLWRTFNTEHQLKFLVRFDLWSTNTELPQMFTITDELKVSTSKSILLDLSLRNMRGTIMRDKRGAIIRDKRPVPPLEWCISADVMSFAFRDCIWKILWGYVDPADSTRRTPEPKPNRFAKCTLPSTHSSSPLSDVILSQNGDYVLTRSKDIDRTNERRDPGKAEEASRREIWTTFSLKLLYPESENSILQAVELRTWTNQVFIVDRAVFHPTACLLCFVSQNGNWLWNFTLDEVPTSLGSYDRQNTKRMHFSKCGAYVVSEMLGESAITVTKIPDHFFGTGSASDGAKDKRSTTEDTESPHRQSEGSNKVLYRPNPAASATEGFSQLSNCHPGLVVSDFTTTSDLNGKNAGAVLSTRTVGNAIHLQASMGDEWWKDADDNIYLAAIPQLRSTQDIRIDVKIPGSSTESTKIVLHEGDAAGGIRNERHYPIIVERDSRFLSRPPPVSDNWLDGSSAAAPRRRARSAEPLPKRRRVLEGGEGSSAAAAEQVEDTESRDLFWWADQRQ